MRIRRFSSGLVLFVFLLAGCATSQELTRQTAVSAVQQVTEHVEEQTREVAVPDTVKPGRFDTGKMWTFDNPPVDYFEEAYGFRPDEEWFKRARLGALRFANYCSASFVSPNGLVLTNRHCGRESVVKVTREGEDLLRTGFYAPTLEAERPVEGLYVEQLIDIEDVTDEVNAALAEAQTEAERAMARQQVMQRIEERVLEAHGGKEAGVRVQIVSLYHGGKYSAYTYRRYDDVRLVMAPELSLGYFGGDPDNFTYPRYALDMSLFRVYDKDGKPLKTPYYFAWEPKGVKAGDAVFVVGNPGSTSRLKTVTQLEYTRDYVIPYRLAWFKKRVQILRHFMEKYPERARELDIENLVFSLENAIKAYEGRLKGLHDPVLMARRRAGERVFRQAIEADSTLNAQYGQLFDQIAEIQKEKASIAPLLNALSINPRIGSVILSRALYGYMYALQKQMGAPEERLAQLKEQLLSFPDRPREIEKELIQARLEELIQQLGVDDSLVQKVLQGRTPEEAAEDIAMHSALADSAQFARLLDGNFLESDDPAIQFVRTIFDAYSMAQRQMGVLQNREQELESRLARARFDVYGTSIPPDATFTLRIADGVVKGYPYNGTIAPPYTTFYGMYDRHYSFDEKFPWDLPERWKNPPASFDKSTKLNLVSTNDIIGGNSGSPLLNKDLKLVGLIFDGNIESLPNEFIYTDETARAVSVDVRGMLEALEEIYQARRIVHEVLTGELVPSEEVLQQQ